MQCPLGMSLADSMRANKLALVRPPWIFSFKYPLEAIMAWYSAISSLTVGSFLVAVLAVLFMAVFSELS